MANSVDPDQTPCSVASNLGLHCLQRPICPTTCCCCCCCVDFFKATRHPRHIEAAAIAMMYMYLYSLAHLVPLSVTKCHPVHFILNPGHVEYELGVLMV